MSVRGEGLGKSSRIFSHLTTCHAEAFLAEASRLAIAFFGQNLSLWQEDPSGA
jgi:hypothetical protein